MRWLTLLVLLLINVVYVYIGGAIFYLVEGNSSNLVSFNSLIDKVFEGEVVVNRSKLADLVIAAFETNRHGHLVGPWNSSARLGILWDYQNSVFFTATIVTSIGYGYLAPRTDTGRYLCLVFACLGIPLFMAFISLLGDKLNQSTHWLTQHGCLKDKESLGKIVRLLLFISVGGCMFLFTPAYCISVMEGWSFQESIYYGFITLSTIGFGDYVAGTNSSINYPVWYQGLRTIWIYTGLAWLAMVVRLQQDAIGVFVRARETDVVITSRKVQASLMKRLSPTSQEQLPDEDNLDLRSSWMNLFRLSISRIKREDPNRLRSPRPRTVVRTASAPIYEERSEDLMESRHVLASLPSIQSVGTPIEMSVNQSQDVEIGQLSPLPSPFLSETASNNQTTSTNQVYVEVHDHFVIECPCEECHNVITVDRQTKINSKHQGNQGADNSAGASLQDMGTPHTTRSASSQNGQALAFLQNEKDDTLTAAHNKTNDTKTSHHKTNSSPICTHKMKHSNPKPRRVSDSNVKEYHSESKDSGRNTSASSPSKVSQTNHDRNDSKPPGESNKANNLQSSDTADFCHRSQSNNMPRTNSLKMKRALFARNSRKNVWEDFESMKSSSICDEDGQEEGLKEDKTHTKYFDRQDDLIHVDASSASNGLSSVNEVSDSQAKAKTQKTIQRRSTVTETPLCNISQFYKEQVGFVIT